MIALAWGGSASALAQRVSVDAAIRASDKPYIQATGEATVAVKPDRALIEIGVVNQGASATAAAAQNARKTDAVMAELHKLLGGAGQLKTISYSVRPSYPSPKPGMAAVINGYVVTNTVEITLDDLTQLSKVIDGATQSGANSIQRLQYRLKNPRLARGQALREAAEDAKAGAEAIASGLGLKVIRVLSAEELTPGDDSGAAYKKVPPPAAQPGVPVEVATIDIDATVILRVEIGQ
jgi:uncharacterized protein YggE